MKLLFADKMWLGGGSWCQDTHRLRLRSVLSLPFPYHCTQAVTSPFREDLTAAHTKGNSSSGGIVIDPEGHPREDGDQDGGHIRLKNEVTNVSLQPKTQRKSRVGTYSKHKGTVRSHSRRSTPAPASRGQWHAPKHSRNWEATH